MEAKDLVDLVGVCDDIVQGVMSLKQAIKAELQK
jgi:hypothetical protein